MTSGPWWQTFFDGLIVESQRQIAGISPTKAEADFLEQELALKPGEWVLDIPCGNGRLALELAARGYAVTGADLCEPLLSDARAAAREKKLAADWHLADMRNPPPGPFDAAFCFGNSFSYFDDEGNAEFLRAVAGVLKPGGRFLLETHFVAETVFGQLTPKRWFEFGDLLFLHDTAYDPPTGMVTSDYRLMRGGKTEQKQAKYRVYTFKELAAMIAVCGLTVMTAYGSLGREPFGIGSPGLWVVARRSA